MMKWLDALFSARMTSPRHVHVLRSGTSSVTCAAQVIRKRYATYLANLAEVMGPFEGSTIVYVDGQGTPQEVYQRVKRELAKVVLRKL